MKPTPVFDVFIDYRKRLFTKNLVKGVQVYGEKLVAEKGTEFREWNVRRSKLAAAIEKGCPNIFLRPGQRVLYLGCSTGTTVSHVSDLVGKNGLVFALDFAPRVMREMVFVAMDRGNIAPILGDANQPATYQDRVSPVDIVYQDVAQRNQVSVFLKNIDMYLKPEGYALLAVKARSIDVTRKPKGIFAEVKAELERTLTIVDFRTLDPLEKDHAFFICKKK
ncbi:MAG: fibrillarin-like rRNA/tRNA 2'-O-methyltransferase [Nanoarchaeota archaeon]|nr:fibrillarin-like rRNA/tRNA 2'-O-methyltransferase [Nanoarchaeota archaeon]